MNREEGRVVPIFSRNQWKFTDPETRDKDYNGAKYNGTSNRNIQKREGRCKI